MQDMLENIRQREFPWADEHCYLNNASSGPIPERTRTALAEFNARRATGPGLDDSVLDGLSDRARRLAADLMGCTKQEIALVPSTSYGLSAIAAALRLGDGDRVVVSRGEFPANVYPWLLQEERGASVEFVDSLENGLPDIETMLDLVASPGVRVLALSLVQFSSGYRADIEEISEHCRRNGVLLVIDGIQGLGCFPFDVRAAGADVVVAGAQKWLMSPWGVGVMYVRADLHQTLEPAFAGWLSFAKILSGQGSLVDYDREWAPDARRYEMGTLPHHNIAGLVSSLELVLEVGPDVAQQHARRIREPIAELNGDCLELVSPVDPKHDSSIICFKTADTSATFGRIKEAGITCAMREGVIRLSPHFYNTVDELTRVAEVVKRS